MGIIIDVILVLFILGSVYLGYKKGLVSVAVSLIAFIAAIVITLLLYRPIGNLIIEKTNWDENLQKTIQEKINGVNKEENKDKENFDIANELVDSAKKEIVPETSKNIAINIIYGGTMIGLFIVSRLLLMLVNLLSEAITSLPIIKQFNETGGILYGLIRGLIIAYGLLLLLNLLISLDPNGGLNDIVQSSILTKMLINYNLLTLFFNK